MKTEPDYFWYAGSLMELDVSSSEFPMQIRLNEAPPYMVAQTSLYELYCAPWGHDVWKVKVLEIGDMSNIRADCGYLRAKVIEKIERVDRGLLFGSHGSGVVAILDHIAQLSLEQVAFLATYSTQGVPQQAIKNQVIHRWCKDYAPNRYPPESYDWTNILQIPDTHEEMGSPVAQGLIILHDLWQQLAKRLVGDAVNRH